MSNYARNPFVAGLLGGLVVLIVGVIAVAAGWVGEEKTTVVQSQRCMTTWVVRKVA